MYPEMKDAFRKPLTEGGWLGKIKQKYNADEQLWLARREAITDQPDFFHNSFDWYVDANRLAMGEWDSLRKTHPFLFEGANIQDDIVRIYDGATYSWAKELHEKAGVLLTATEGSAIKAEYPHFTEAFDNGLVAGVIKVKGFSFDLQRFMLNAIKHLENLGVEMTFATEVTEIERNGEGQVTGLLAITNGRQIRLEADNYSLHMGAYDVRALLKDTSAENRIAGMEGRWTITDAPKGMEHSLKLHGDTHEIDGQPRPVIDQNHAVFKNNAGEEKAIIGFGYLFSGFDPNGVEAAEKAENDKGNHAIIERIFPSHYAAQKEAGKVEWVNRGCVRSWTDDDLPRADELTTKSGGKLLINGGGNTGSTTQAPTQALLNIGKLGHRVPLELQFRLEELHRQSNSIMAQSGFEMA